MSKTTSANRPFQKGAEWARVDFHLHTNADKEFQFNGDITRYNSAYVDALETAKIQLGIITNHNKFDYKEFKSLRATAKKKSIGLLPGVELSINEGQNGVHVLIMFSDEWLHEGIDYITPFIGSMFPGKTPDQYQHENGKSDKNLLQLVETLEGLDKDFLLVFAHVEDAKGLWKEVGCGRLGDWNEDRYAAIRRRTLGFQKVRSYNKLEEAGKPCKAKVSQALGGWYPAEVEGSDPKAIDQIGKGRPCYLKLGEFSFEAVKFALFDLEHRVAVKLPDNRTTATIAEISFEGGALDGTRIPFSDSLNCLIGPRGNGKSAIIECMRHALGFDAESDEHYKIGLVDCILSPAGKIVVIASDEYGRSIRVEREKSGRPSVYIDDEYEEVSPGSVLSEFLYFGQKDLSTRSESFDESFLDRLLADRLDSQTQEEQRLLEQVQQAVKELKDTINAAEKIAALCKEQNELKVQLQVFVEKGLDKKLEEMTVFDADVQSVVRWKDNLKGLEAGLKSSLDWSDTDEAFPELKSKSTEAIADDLSAAKKKSDEAKASAEEVMESLREAYRIISEGIKKLDPAKEKMKFEVAELQKIVNEPQLDLAGFRKKKARLEQLKTLLDAGAKKSKSEQSARNTLGAKVNELHDFWRERFTEREAEVRSLEKELPRDIRIQTSFKGKSPAFEAFLRETMRGSGLQASAYEAIREAFVDGRELYQSRADLEEHVSEAMALKVLNALSEKLYEFLTYRTPDESVILYQGKPLGDYSLGQRATVILHILMHLRRNPVIFIDQPEDDLDNETLYTHFIQQLLDRKEMTQFIFATHNPNIPVLGDAEQAIVCRKDGDIFSFEHGSIDDRAIQKRIVTVMEGGEDAFRRRREIYQLWKGDSRK